MAQRSSILIGKVTDFESGEPIYSVHVINLKSKQGTITNKKGFFLIPIEEKNYLKFSYLGYNNYYIQISKVTNDTLQIFLYKKTYQLESVTIYPWTKEEFQYQFVNNDFNEDSIDRIKALISVPKEELVAELRNAKTERMRENNPGMIAGVSMPAFSNYKTNKEKQIAKLEALKKWVRKEEAYRKLIKKITNYSGTELNTFISFCNFSKNYITNARDYYLALNIQKKYLEFEELKEQSKNTFE